MFPPGTTLADYIPGATVALDRTTYLADGRLKCHWAVMCAEHATHTISHPILGQVLTCPSHTTGPTATPLSECRWCGQQIHQVNELAAREANKHHPADAEAEPVVKPGDWVHGVAGVRCGESAHEHEPDGTDTD